MILGAALASAGVGVFMMNVYCKNVEGGKREREGERERGKI
jgi:hypothetical protein